MTGLDLQGVVSAALNYGAGDPAAVQEFAAAIERGIATARREAKP